MGIKSVKKDAPQPDIRPISDNRPHPRPAAGIQARGELIRRRGVEI